MKSIAKFFLNSSLAFCFAGAVFGQDAAAPFRRRSPTPPPVQEQTPAPKPQPTPSAPPTQTPTVAPEARPTPQPSAPAPATPPLATRAPEEEEKPGRRILREKPVRAVEPRKPWISRIPAEKTEGPPAYRPTIDLTSISWTTKSTLRSLENKWQSAIKNHDVDALDKLLDEDFIGTSASGRKASKARMLRELRNDKNVYRSARTKGMSVRMVRDRVATVTGIATETGTTAEGKKFTASRSFTDTWKLRDGTWKCVSSEVKPVPKADETR